MNAELTDEFFCMPICKSCRLAKSCPRAFEAPTHITVQMVQREWAPNRLPRIKLPCGCVDIPWPLWHKLGENFDTVFCSDHGIQKITRNFKKKKLKPVIKQFEMDYDEYVKYLVNPTIEGIDVNDRPPF